MVREMRMCSQKQVSQLSGLSQSQISRIEAGERAASLYALSRIAKALRVSPGYLMEQNADIPRGGARSSSETSASNATI